MSELRSRSEVVDRWDVNDNVSSQIDKNVKTRVLPSIRPEDLFSKIRIRGSLIDIPLVSANLKAGYLLHCFFPSSTLLQTPRGWYSTAEENEKDLNDTQKLSYRRLSCLDSSDEEYLLNTSLSEISQWPESDIPDSTNSDVVHRILRNKVKNSRTGGNVILGYDDEGHSIYLENYDLKLKEQSKETEKKVKTLWNQLRIHTSKIFEWNLGELQKCQHRYNAIIKYGVVKEKGGVSASINKKYVEDTLSSLRLHFSDDNEMLKPAKRFHTNASWPDVCKFFAYMAWSKGDMQKCAYYLSESHGTFWKIDTCDKHNSYLRLQEASYNTQKKEIIKEHEILKQKVYKQQCKALLEFGTSFANFQKLTKKNFQPCWNVIQISTNVHTSNRFGKELSDFKEMPGIWITCFNSLRSGEVRSTTHYVEKCKGNIWEESFIKLISDNKRVSDGYNGDRKTYWNTRSKHNSQLRIFLETFENWIAPYTFLFPGHLKSSDIKSEIWECVDKIEKICAKPLSDSMTIIVYKLVENFKYFPGNEIELSYFLQTSIAVSLEVAKNIVAFLAELDCKAPEKGVLERHETIVILDAELERYPLDWLPVFQKSSTPVNRMFSMAHIYATAEVTNQFIENYPVSVQPKKGMYIINPDQSLEGVQQRLEGYLGARDWKGVCARNPSNREFEKAVEKQDVMVYCGHGSGGNMYPDWAISRLLCRAVPILMGCSSAQTTFLSPKCFHSAAVHSYFSAVCPSVVGFLWEITDIECDRVTLDLLERWLPCSKGLELLPPIPNFEPNKERQKEMGLSSSVMKSRLAATQFMTEAAIVVYGLPVYTVGDKKPTIVSCQSG